jgi:hypothetical protein
MAQTKRKPLGKAGKSPPRKPKRHPVERSHADGPFKTHDPWTTIWAHIAAILLAGMIAYPFEEIAVHRSGSETPTCSLSPWDA